jgi:hypothetical protein
MQWILHSKASYNRKYHVKEVFSPQLWTPASPALQPSQNRFHFHPAMYIASAAKSIASAAKYIASATKHIAPAFFLTHTFTTKKRLAIGSVLS